MSYKKINSLRKGKKVPIIFPSGKRGEEYTIGNFIRLRGESFYRRVNSDGTLSKVADGSNGTYNYQNQDVPEEVRKSNIGSKYKRALYSTNNPTGAYPENKFNAIPYWIDSKLKSFSDNPDKMDYEIGEELSDSVSDAAWRKYLGLPYNSKFLLDGVPDDRTSYGKNTVRLPKKLEEEIPTDTVLLKNRISANEKYIDGKKSWEVPQHVYTALEADREALEALRKTYAEGIPVGISEFAYNSRNWGVDPSGPHGGTPPLNILQNYNIRYDKSTNRMYYSDTYDFNQFDWWLGGTPFRIRGYIDLTK